MKTCRQSNASEAVLAELIAHNLASLEKQIDYNIRSRIGLFRISSDLIPFGSSPVNRIPWWEVFAKDLDRIGSKIRESGMRVSMHPGQYTVINSPEKGVVDRAAEDLIYHTRVLESLNLDRQHKIVLHVGGVYQDKEAAMSRFLDHFRALPETVRGRLILENDDRSYHTGDVLSLARRAELPAVFDNLHDRVNPDPLGPHWTDVLRDFAATWRKEDGPQKIHYSQQDPGRKPGSHSRSVAIDPFLDFIRCLPDPCVDVMLEVKDKNLSAVKCILCTQPAPKVRDLEEEWKRYKYKVMERSQGAYDQIRVLFSGQNRPDPVAFYRLVENALREEERSGGQVNAAQHVWGYFKKQATPGEQDRFFKLIKGVETGTVKGKALRKHLYGMTLRYGQSYLMESYYFYL